MGQSDSMVVGLAPMEGITDFPMRLWFALTSQPAVCSSPFLRVTDTFPNLSTPASHYWPELGYAKGLVPYDFVPQLMASNLEPFVRTGEHILKSSPTVELNCGCPAPTVVGHHAGSSLLRETERFAQWVERGGLVLGSEHLRIKMRTGFHDASEFPPLLAVLQAVRLKRLTVHGRTRKQHYTGSSAWHLIQAAAETLATPVIGSGDIVSYDALQKLMGEAPLVRESLVGRGASRNPWIFEELRSANVVTLSRSALLHALEVYALLQLLHAETPERLEPLVQSGVFMHPCKADDASWDLARRAVADAWDKQYKLEDIALPRKVLGRVKMVWTYLRTSIGDGAMNPLILRAKSLPEFLRLVSDYTEEKVTLQHRAEFDYLFSGAEFS